VILADTSVWIDHFHAADPTLKRLLREDRILIHPFVIGEIACGGLPKRGEVLRDLRRLPSVTLAEQHEAFALLEEHRLWGHGVGWIDVHLLASALLTRCRLWTLDQRLRSAAIQLKVNYPYLQ